FFAARFRSKNMIDATKFSHASVTQEQLARLGSGSIAYVKAVRSEEVPALFPHAPALEPGMELFMLLAADGAPIMLTDSRDAALANAQSQALRTVSVH